MVARSADIAVRPAHVDSKPIRTGLEVLCARMMPGIASGVAAMLPSSKRREKFVIECVSQMDCAGCCRLAHRHFAGFTRRREAPAR